MSDQNEPSRAQKLIGDFSPKLLELTAEVFYRRVGTPTELAEVIT